MTEVQRMIEAVLPGTRFFKEPSGPDKIKIAREHGIEFPPIVREELERIEESYRGDYEADGFSVEFWFGSSECVDDIHVDVRGRGDATKALWEIVARTGWRVIHDATGTELTDADWSGFQAWRDKAIREIKGELGAPPNGGPVTRFGNSGVTEGPPSVS